MIRPIVKDPLVLSRPSVPATREDLPVAQDLLDTLRAHAHECVGMAANMIGVHKRIIAFDNGGVRMVMLNPTILSKSEPFAAQEGCLSLAGVRAVRRWRKIEVRYQTRDFAVRTARFEGWTAQIIQHEIDHCAGILI